MKLRTLTIAAILALTPIGAFAMCKGEGHDVSANICLDGMVWDQEAQACVEMVTG